MFRLFLVLALLCICPILTAAEKGDKALYIFTAEWCGPCNQLKADVKSDGNFQNRFDGIFKIAKYINVKDFGEHQLSVVPTIRVYEYDGSQWQFRGQKNGYGSKESLKNFLDQFLPKAESNVRRVQQQASVQYQEPVYYYPQYQSLPYYQPQANYWSGGCSTCR